MLFATQFDQCFPFFLTHPLTNSQTIYWKSLSSSGQEQKGWCCFGDGLNVFFVVTAAIVEHQVIYDSHNAHEWQEKENSFSEQEARSAVRHTRRICQHIWFVKIRMCYKIWWMDMKQYPGLKLSWHSYQRSAHLQWFSG